VAASPSFAFAVGPPAHEPGFFSTMRLASGLTCYANQAAAQNARDTRDANGDGMVDGWSSVALHSVKRVG
jgi:hypothetical protein